MGGTKNYEIYLVAIFFYNNFFYIRGGGRHDPFTSLPGSAILSNQKLRSHFLSVPYNEYTKHEIQNFEIYHKQTTCNALA